jgi:hypothetical protein
MPITTLVEGKKAYVYPHYVFLELEDSTLIVKYVLVEIRESEKVLVVVDRLGVKHAFRVEDVVVVR